MTMTKPFIPLASTAAVLLALSQTLLMPTALATESQPAPTKPAPPAQYPATAQDAISAPTPTPAETARAQAEERRAAMQEERKKRYAELRASAAEMGVEMPETPPWEAAMPAMPETAPHGMWQEDDAARRQWREEMQARMRTMTPEERLAMRNERWKKMRADAAERGIEMPETPPWEEAEKQRQEMAKRFDEYRKTVDAMTDEQREAARALFGRPPARMAPPMPCHDGDQGHEPWGYPREPWGMTHPRMMPDQDAPGYDQGPPPWATGN